MPEKTDEIGSIGIRAKCHKLVWFIAFVSIRCLTGTKHYLEGFTGVPGIHLYTIVVLEQMRSMWCLTKKSVLLRYVIEVVI